MTSSISSTHLGETNRCRLFTEALTAKIKTVLANETSLMGTQAAKDWVVNMRLWIHIAERTIACYPFQICVGERTKWRRVSFFCFDEEDG